MDTNIDLQSIEKHQEECGKDKALADFLGSQPASNDFGGAIIDTRREDKQAKRERL